MPEKCAGTCPQLDKLENEVHALRDQNSDSHREIFKRLNDLELTNAVQDERYKATMDKLDEISEKQDSLGAKIGALEAKPGKRWDSMVDKAIWAFLAAVIAFMLGRIGL